MEQQRIDAEIVPVVDCAADLIVEHSRDAAAVFLPIRLEGMRVQTPLAGDLLALLARLPICTLVVAAQDISLGEEDAEADGHGGPRPAQDGADVDEAR
jgi:hypothetical protein